MIIFYSDNQWELNLTNLKITFIEENALFYDAFYKNYTLPFSLSIDNETSIKLGMIDLDNVAGYKVKHSGKLFIDNDFFDAYFVAEKEQENIECTIFFGKITLPLMETPLAALPFPLISTTSISAWADSIKTKTWPEVSHSFPMVFDDEFKNETSYDFFEGIVNNRIANNFVTNSLDPGGDILNKNIIVPFPYLMEILNVGFASAGKQIIGDFPNHKPNHHILLNTKKHLEQFSSTTFEEYQFNSPTDEYINANSVLVYEYIKAHTLALNSSYDLKCFFNLPDSINVISFSITRGTDIIFQGSGNALNKTFTINRSDGDTNASTVIIKLIIQSTTIDISLYNNFFFEKTEGKLNIFKNTFSLSEVMPDITFGQLLNKIANWQNLKIDLQSAYVRIDYVENNFLNVKFKDESLLEIKHPKREFNKSKIYKLIYSQNDFILVNKDELIYNTTGYKESDIVKIEMGLQMLPITTREGYFTALRKPTEGLSFLLYNGIDINGNPVASESVYGYDYSLIEVYNKWWSKWLKYRLNSEKYTDTFTAHALEGFSINDGRFKYNKKHLYKKIKRTRISETQWKVEIESETF